MHFKRILNIFIYIYCFTIVFQNYEGLSIAGNSIPKFVGLALFGLLLVNHRLFNRFLYTRIIAPLLFFMLVILMSCIFYTVNDWSWITKYNTILLNVLFSWLMLSFVLKNPEKSDALIQFFVYGAGVTSVLYFFNIGVTFEDKRLAIFGENSNTVGIYSAFAFLYIFIKFIENPNKKKILSLLPLILLLPLINVISLSGSRITFIGLVFTMFGYFIVKKNKNLDRAVFARLFGIGVMYILVTYMLSFDVLSSRLISSVEEGDLSGRDRIWNYVLPTVLDNPVFGVGISGYTEITTKIFGNFFSPHNVYIEVFAYSGIVGLFIFFGIFYFRLLKLAFSVNNKLHNALPLLYLLFILMIFASGQGMSNKFYWLVYVYVFGEYIRANPTLGKNHKGI